MDDASNIVERAKDLENRIDDRQAVIDDLLSYTRKNRRNTRVAIGLSIVLVVVVGVLGYTVIRVRSNTLGVAQARDVAVAVADNLRATCEADNKDKAKEAELWRLIFAIPPVTPRTPEQQAQAASLEAFVVSVYSPDDCTVEAP